ncbi:MbcA/ParS/Xre antitoxin family protein [Marinobacter sp. 1Y8]
MNDGAWINYLKAVPAINSNCDVYNELDYVIGDSEISKVIFFHFGDESIKWVAMPVPALDHRTPKDCMSTEQGKVELKNMLMKMH